MVLRLERQEQVVHSLYPKLAESFGAFLEVHCCCLVDVFVCSIRMILAEDYYLHWLSARIRQKEIVV